MSCWSCGAEPVDGRFCAACQKLQPVDPTCSFFEVLGLPRRMKQDGAALERSFRDASRHVHPDRFRAKSAIERRLALEQTTVVNEAYQRLKDPRRRAEYLLSLEGIEIGSEEHRTDDPELLMEMMELTEAIDSAKSTETVDELAVRLERERSVILGVLEAYFDEGTGEATEAARQLERLRYIARLQERIEGKRER